jgi:two-component system response regulator ResD
MYLTRDAQPNMRFATVTAGGAPAAAPEILVAAEEMPTRRLLEGLLAGAGYAVVVAGATQEAPVQARTRQPALVLLELGRPAGEGLEVCRRIREAGDTPLIVLGDDSGAGDRITALDLGADDYLAKPFEPRELIARVKAVLRGYAAGRRARTTRTLALGDLRIDLDKREVWVGDRPADLHAKEFQLLVALVERPGTVVTYQRLLDTVWGLDYWGDHRTIGVHVSWLRQKLAGSTVEIQSIRGVGYKVAVREAPVEK